MEILNNKICRACNTEQNNLVHIFKQNEPTSIITMLEYCTRITPTDELKYPPWICFNCVKELEICFRFLRRFNMAQDEFLVAYNHMNEMEESDEHFKMTENMKQRIRKSPGLKSTCQENEELTENVKSEEPAIELSVESSEPITETGATKTAASNNITTELRQTTSAAVTCSMCRKVFFTTKALNLHLKLGHKQKKPIS